MPKSSETAEPRVDHDGNVRTLEHVHMDGMGILSFVNSKVPQQLEALLARNRLELDEVDLFLFHQASKLTLESLIRLAGVPLDRVFMNIRDRGNTVSASIPIAIKDAMEAGRWRPGSRVILSGFGVGLSWATALVQL